MPNIYVVLNDGTVVVELWTGQVTHDELLAHQQRHLNDPSIKIGASVLVDAENAHFGTTAEQVKDIVVRYGEMTGRLRIGRKALLVNRETYDRALLLVKESEGYGVRGIIFNSLDIACIWLGLDIAMVRRQLQALKAQLASADSSVARKSG